MIEDKLQPSERLRLEALSQAIVRGMSRAESDEQIISRAKVFEQYISGNEIHFREVENEK